MWPGPHAASRTYEFRRWRSRSDHAARCGFGRIDFQPPLVTGLDDLALDWVLEADGRRAGGGTEPVPATAPRSRTYLTLPVERPETMPGEKLVLRVSLKLKNACAWAEAGHEVASEPLNFRRCRSRSRFRRSRCRPG